MSTLVLAQVVALAGLLVAVGGLAARWREVRRRPVPADRAPAKGDPARGVRYAFTFGMAPWAKESTRLHALAYLRGVGFHLAIFAGLTALAAYPVWTRLPGAVRDGLAAFLAFGAILSAAGAAARLREPNLRALSTPDDYVSVWLVTLFLVLTALALWSPRFVVPMYLAAGVLLAYIPLGKIRHCLYFFFSRTFFGRFVGRRGVLPHPARPAPLVPAPVASAPLSSTSGRTR